MSRHGHFCGNRNHEFPIVLCDLICISQITYHQQVCLWSRLTSMLSFVTYKFHQIWIVLYYHVGVFCYFQAFTRKVYPAWYARYEVFIKLNELLAYLINELVMSLVADVISSVLICLLPCYVLKKISSSLFNLCTLFSIYLDSFLVSNLICLSPNLKLQVLVLVHVSFVSMDMWFKYNSQVKMCFVST